MSLAPRPASPGTNVPSRNRSAPLELCFHCTGFNRPRSPEIPARARSAASSQADLPHRARPSAAAGPLTSGPLPYDQSRSLARSVTSGSPRLTKPRRPLPLTRKSSDSRHGSAGRSTSMPSGTAMSSRCTSTSVYGPCAPTPGGANRSSASAQQRGHDLRRGRRGGVLCDQRLAGPCEVPPGRGRSPTRTRRCPCRSSAPGGRRRPSPSTRAEARRRPLLLGQPGQQVGCGAALVGEHVPDVHRTPSVAAVSS